MATPMFTRPSQLGEVRAASASAGTALTTTAVFIQLPNGTRHVFITGRNYSTAVVARVALNPYLAVIKTTDALATTANATDYSNNAQDASTSTSVALSNLNTAAASNYLYVGAALPFRGVNVVVANANAVASVLTVNYWNGAWTSASVTDGTASAGATFAITGNATWTVPSDWVATTLVAAGAATPQIPLSGQALYWTRWQVSAQLGATVNASSMLAMNRSTAYSEWIASQTFEEEIGKGVGGIGCIEALTDAGTANLVVNVAVGNPRNAFS